jgi:hypothetical protein
MAGLNICIMGKSGAPWLVVVLIVVGYGSFSKESNRIYSSSFVCWTTIVSYINILLEDCYNLPPRLL